MGIPKKISPRLPAPSDTSQPLLRIPKRLGSPFRVPILLHYLERHRLACSVVTEPASVWAALVPHAEVSAVHLERLYAKNNEREHYNDEQLSRARASRRIVMGEHRGFSDFFVPVVTDGTVVAELVCGPFRRAPFTTAQICANWKATSGRAVDPSDRDLLAYTRGSIGAANLEAPVLLAIESLLSLVASMLGGSRDGPRSFDRFVRRHLSALDSSRESMWDLSTGLVDPARVSMMLGGAVAARYVALGIRRMFTHVLAVAFEARDGGVDPVEEIVRANALAHQGVSFAHDLGETLCGPLGDGGVFFLTSAASANDAKGELASTASRIRELVRATFGVAAHVGVSTSTMREDDLPRCYDEAVLALHSALHESRPVVFYEDGKRKRARTLHGEYRTKVSDLHRAVEAGAAGAAGIAAHGVSREVLWRAGGRPEAVRAYFESLTLDLVERVDQRGALDVRSMRGLETTYLSALGEAKSVASISSAFERIASSLAESVKRPTPASTRARLETAMRYTRENSHLPLRVRDAARQAGLSANYFSTLFRKQYGVGFEAYLVDRRLEKARALLLSSALPVARISRNSGFSSHVHFCTAFRRKFGTTPTRYREEPRRPTSPSATI